MNGNLYAFNFPRYIVQSQDIPRDVRARAESSDVRITSLSFSYDDPTLFLVGTEGGALLLGSTLSQVEWFCFLI